MIQFLNFISLLFLVACSVSKPTIDQGVGTNNLPIKIEQGMPYLKARNLLTKSGWQTVTMHTTSNGTPTCWAGSETSSIKESCKFEEIDNCSGTGMGFCLMWFFDGEHNKYLRVRTSGGEPPSDAYIDNWNTENELQKQ